MEIPKTRVRASIRVIDVSVVCHGDVMMLTL
jgi:hypothetical protein